MPIEPPDLPDNVIRVAFGSARRTPALEPVVADEPQPTVPHRYDPSDPDPVSAVYSTPEVARILGIPAARIRAWEKSGLVVPSAEQNGERLYTFQDLVGVRMAADLVRHGIPTARVRRILVSLRRLLPGATPLSELRVVSDGRTVTARANGTAFDPLTGQVLLDFTLSTLRDEVVQRLPSPGARRGVRTAYDHFLEGCRLDADESSRSRAEACYRRALALDPTLACAYTNLGLCRLSAGDKLEALSLFRRAVSLDGDQPEAAYNLGCVALADHRMDEALHWLTRCVAVDPGFADGHFNLAVALDRAGRTTDALPHWQAYLALAPGGPYAAVARQRLPARRG